MEKKYLSDCIRYTTDIAPYPFIQIYSGVGSGKNTFVDALAKGYEESQPDGRMETLEPKRVLCITSRRAKVDELKNAEDVAYAVQNSAPESPFEYELSGRADLKASLNALLAQKKEDAGIAEGAPWSVQEHEEIRSYIAYIQKKFPHFCYDYFADTFCLYSDRHSSRRYYAEQNAAFVRAKEEGSLLSLVGKWFPQADIAFANKKQQRIDAYFHAQDVLNVPLEKSAVQEIKAYLETVIGQPFRSFNHFMRPYGYAIRKASGNTTSPNYGKQIITRIGTDKT